MEYETLRLAYLKHTRLPASDLGRFALTLPPSDGYRRLNKTQTQRLRELLFAVNHIADRSGNTEQEVAATLISARRFIDEYPHDSFTLDQRCVEVAVQAKAYPALAQWLAGTPANQVGLPMPQAGTNTGAPKYTTSLQKFISSIARVLDKPTLTALKAYLKDEGAVEGGDFSPLEGEFDCGEIYLAGQRLVFTDRNGRECSITLRSVERYLRRAKDALKG
jgi:hypothetical protein